MNFSLRRSFLTSLLLLAAPSALLFAQDADDDHAYVPPAGTAAPVAPPLKKGSPLDHLANDPRVEALPAGFREGNTSGPDVWIAHRFVDPYGGLGWGWVKKEGESWSSAQWIALKETPGRVVEPERKITKSDGDLDYEFKFWGKIAGYKAYDPRVDEILPVFVLEGYEVIGQANPLTTAKAGASNRSSQRRSGASSRASSPILSDTGVD